MKNIESKTTKELEGLIKGQKVIMIACLVIGFLGLGVIAFDAIFGGFETYMVSLSVPMFLSALTPMWMLPSYKLISKELKGRTEV